MARTLLLSFILGFSSLSIAQNFHQKYDIDGFFELADFNQPKKTFKEFKAHLEFQDIQFDNLFREEFEVELENYPDAMAIYKMYKNRGLFGLSREEF